MDNKKTELFEGAKAAYAVAYAPYSKFSVGAAIKGVSGKVYSGCNVENVAYPQGVCAEASAISAMILAGETQIAEILVYSEASTAIFPCGGCRQKILEFASESTQIHIASDKGISHSVRIADLMPYSFDKENLNS